MNNRFLVAGDEFLIKFWDIENVNLLTTANANGELLASPCIRLSKEGVLLAVSASNNSVKILGNAKGRHLVNTVHTWSVIARNVAKNGDGRTWPVVIHRMTGEMKNSRVWKPEEINKQSQLRCLGLPDSLVSAQITRLIYTNSGGAILGLASNAIHLLWKWHKDERNPDGKATVNVLPELWEYVSGRRMTNDISETNPEDAAACLALSNDDSFVVSGSGGKISAFNIETFKTMTTCMPPPPAATFLALSPQDNNILALGMQDSSIQIYDFKIDKVTYKLEGHQDRVTGLAFSIVLNALVSSGADDQICVWNMDGWNKQASEFVHIPAGRAPSPPRQNHVQFHQDQTHMLVFNENLIAIYEAPELKCIKQWFPESSSGSVTCATYSCNSQAVYVAFDSGNIIVFSAALSPQCQISPGAYISARIRSSLQLHGTRVYPLAIAAHPTHPNQFALALTHFGVHVLEPLVSESRWGTITVS